MCMFGITTPSNNTPSWEGSMFLCMVSALNHLPLRGMPLVILKVCFIPFIHYYYLFYFINNKQIGTEGEVLASFQLIPYEQAASYPITNIAPQEKVLIHFFSS